MTTLTPQPLVPAAQAGATFSATGTQSNLEKARALVSYGFAVFPAYHEDTWIGDRLHERKTPLKGTRGFHSATTDPADVELIWGPQGDPNFLVAVACGASHIVVLDIDMNEAQSKDGWANLWSAFGEDFEPTTFGYETSSGGHHYIYKATTPDHRALKNTRGYVTAQGEIIDDVDRRGKDGYIIWWGPVPASLEELQASVEEVPDWFAFQEPTTADAHTPYDGLVADWMDALPKGQEPSYFVKSFYEMIPTGDFGHDDLIRLQRNIIGYAAEREAGAYEAIETLHDAWLRPPYNTPAYQQDWDTSLAGGIAKYGGAVSEQEKDFWTRRPVLKQIYEASRSELEISPWALLGGAIMRTLHLTPWYVRYRSALPGSLNLAATFVGPSSAGKSTLQDAMDELFDFGTDITVKEIGSGEAIPDAYAFMDDEYIEKDDKMVKSGKKYLHWDEPAGNPPHAVHFSFDEILKLQALESRQGSTVLNYVKTGYSGAPLGRDLVRSSGAGITLPKHEYRFTMYINGQPKLCGSLLSEAQIESGTPSRMLWVNVVDPLIDETQSNYQPKRIPIRLPHWTDPNPYGYRNQAKDQPDFVEVKATEQMMVAYKADRRAGKRGEKESIDGHIMFTRAKVACALAFMDGRTELNDEDWELSGVVIANSIATRNYVISEIAKGAEAETERQGRTQGRREAVAEEAKADTKVERLTKKLVEAAEEAKGEWNYGAWRKVQAHRDRELLDAIAKDRKLDNREEKK